jgi:hypothetical protein
VGRGGGAAGVGGGANACSTDYARGGGRRSANLLQVVPNRLRLVGDRRVCSLAKLIDRFCKPAASEFVDREVHLLQEGGVTLEGGRQAALTSLALPMHFNAPSTFGGAFFRCMSMSLREIRGGVRRREIQTQSASSLVARVSLPLPLEGPAVWEAPLSSFSSLRLVWMASQLQSCHSCRPLPLNPCALASRQAPAREGRGWVRIGITSKHCWTSGASLSSHARLLPVHLPLPCVSMRARVRKGKEVARGVETFWLDSGLIFDSGRGAFFAEEEEATDAFPLDLDADLVSPVKGGVNARWMEWTKEVARLCDGQL